MESVRPRLTAYGSNPAAVASRGNRCRNGDDSKTSCFVSLALPNPGSPTWKDILALENWAIGSIPAPESLAAGGGPGEEKKIALLSWCQRGE